MVRSLEVCTDSWTETLSNSRSTILENSLSALNIASGNLQTRLETTSQAFNTSMAPLVDFHNTQLRLPLEESQIFKIVESQPEAAGFEKQGGSQVVKQHATTLSASMNKFRKKLATQKQNIGRSQKGTGCSPRRDMHVEIRVGEGVGGRREGAQGRS